MSSAGKGSKPRPVNLKKWDENYDLIFRKRKTVDDWADHFGDRIKSYDGFREYNQDDLLTEEEYKRGLESCTIYVSAQILDGFGNEEKPLDKFDQPVVNNNLPYWKHG